MLYQETQCVRIRRWNWVSLLITFLALVVIANGMAPDKRVSNRGQRQELSLEERFEAEQRLSALGYWTGPVDGTLDPSSLHALIAFQKVENRHRTGKFTKEELQALRAAATPIPLYSDYPHIEIDLGRQVLFIVDAAGIITHILPVCTGDEKSYVDHGQTHRAHTPRGKFKVVRKVAGWRRSSLGLLYYPNYIYEGIAIHGSLAMNVFPASHGCIRIPMYAAKELSEITAIGTEVMVYE